MDKQTLLNAVSQSQADWEQTLDELGPERLEVPGANGEWRVRDVLAHFNGWDHWQLVQLRCAFTGETPTDEELAGGVDFPPNDDLAEDAMNEMFRAGNASRSAEDVVADWRSNCAMRVDWITSASQEQLDAEIGSDFTSGSPRIMRLTSEIPGATYAKPVSQFLLEQVTHQDEHLRIVRDWMSADR